MFRALPVIKQRKISRTDANQVKRRADSKDKDSNQGNRCDVEKTGNRKEVKE